MIKHQFPKRIISILTALATVLAFVLSLAPAVYADTEASYTVFEGQKKLEGWYPSFITQYMEPAKMDGFIQAISHDGAVIEITYSGSSQVSILLQSYPVSNGSQRYPHKSISNPTVTNLSNGRKLASFVAADLIKAYTSEKHPDDGSYLRLDNVLNFGIDGSGNTVYSVVVRWTYAGNPALNVDLNATYQEMDGFGASYTWYGDWVSQNIHKEEIFDWIFNDCGFNILRFRDLQMVRAYGGAWEDTNYRSRAYKEYYDAAIKRGIDPIVLVTSWGQYTEADWCTLSKDAQGNEFYTLKKDSKGNYRYDDLAKFCVKSVRLFIDSGIPVDYFSISNEVELQQYRVDEQGNAKSDAGFFLGAEETPYYCSYAKAYIAVYKAFREAFGSNAPKLLAAETMAANPDLLKRYIDPIIKECPESVDTVAHHLYGSSLTSANFAKISDEYYGKYKIWQTEWYNNDFFDHAAVMINELVNENINAYLYWNGVWIPDNANCLIQIDEWAPTSRVSRRGNHYIMMHFSKFIKKGYIRVDSSAYASGVKTVAFKSPEGDKLVIVALNNTQADESLQLNIGADVVKSEIWRTTKNTSDVNQEERLNKYMESVSANVADGEFVALPKNTLTTFVLDITTHDHIYGEAWRYDGESHWHNCVICGERSVPEPHAIELGGTICAVCGYDSSKILLGDVNGDKRISSVDAVLILRYLAEFKDENVDLAAGDMNGDTRITSLDAVLILRTIAGLI